MHFYSCFLFKYFNIDNVYQLLTIHGDSKNIRKTLNYGSVTNKFFNRKVGSQFSYPVQIKRYFNRNRIHIFVHDFNNNLDILTKFEKD